MKTKSQFLAALDFFTRSYIETALWSSTDNATDSGGEPLDKNFSANDISRKTLEVMAADCAKFQRENWSNLVSMTLSQAGHCFWLSRNGHGSGFFDEDSISETLQDELQGKASEYGTFDLLVYGGKIGGY